MVETMVLALLVPTFMGFLCSKLLVYLYFVVTISHSINQAWALLVPSFMGFLNSSLLVYLYSPNSLFRRESTVSVIVDVALANQSYV